MTDSQVYHDIQKRTHGEIYIGVVGPVRTGKSTFIRKFMENMVIPYLEDGAVKARTRDELPQAGSGKEVMTTEPKFIPTEEISIPLGGETPVKVRLVDCVGFLNEEDHGEGQLPKEERLVKTPWYDHEIPFSKAAETGTQKVIEEHSTIGILVTSDGTFGEYRREQYIKAEEQTIAALKKSRKPFLVVLNTADKGIGVNHLAEELSAKYQVGVFPVNCDKMTESDIEQMLERLLLEFPVQEIEFRLPEWFGILGKEHPLKKEVLQRAESVLMSVQTMKDAQKAAIPAAEEETGLRYSGRNLAQGQVTFEFSIPRARYYEVLNQYTGFSMSRESELASLLKEYALLKQQLVQIESALESVRSGGYGVVMPKKEEIQLEEPILMKHGNRYGVKMKASAPSIHLIKTMVETEIAPIVGTREQAQDLIGYIKEHGEASPEGIWETNIFGKSIEQIVEDGIRVKLSQMTEHCRQKMQESLEKIMNDSNGGVICIII